VPLQFTPPRLGFDFPWNEPAFACRGSHVIRPQLDQLLGLETFAHFLQWGIAFITGNSSLEPLIKGLRAQIHVNLS